VVSASRLADGTSTIGGMTVAGVVVWVMDPPWSGSFRRRVTRGQSTGRRAERSGPAGGKRPRAVDTVPRSGAVSRGGILSTRHGHAIGTNRLRSRLDRVCTPVLLGRGCTGRMATAGHLRPPRRPPPRPGRHVLH